jgi:anti-sigma factor RsiW
MPEAPEQHPRELLPWLVNGGLEDPEREAVTRHVAGCADCQAEVTLLRAMRRGVKAIEPAGAGELGWQRLRRSLGGATRTVTPRWVMPAALAASLVIVAQAALLVTRTPETVRYEPLSGPVAEDTLAQVRFAPEASEAELRALLREAGVRIVDGPSAAGVYLLAAEPDRDPEEAARVLRGRPDLIPHFALER